MIGHTEFGLLGQLVQPGEIVLNGFLALLQHKECGLCVSDKGGGLKGFL